MNPLFTITNIAFVGLTVVMYVLVFNTLKRALQTVNWEGKKQKGIYYNVIGAIVVWTVFISILAGSGFLTNFSSLPPRIIIVLLVPFITILLVTLSRTASQLLSVIAPNEIIRLQVFRVFVEILLWMLFLQSLLPVQMTFEGRNFDVFAGLTAPLIAYFFRQNRSVMIIWNIACLGLLANIVSIAILSMPTPLRMFSNEPANTIITTFPFVWLPGLLVPLAYSLHFLSLRQLVTAKRKPAV